MKAKPNIVIVGAGAAGHAAAGELRARGHTGRITLLHAEKQAPYNRTLVNKAVMQGMLTPEQIALPSLDSLDLDLVHARAIRLDPQRGLLALDTGTDLAYTALIAATGSAPRPGLRGDRVFRVHTAADGVRVRDFLHEKRADTVPNGYAAGGVAVHDSKRGARYRIDHWDAAVAQGIHVARSLLHDLDGAPDPGPYVPTTGFNLNLYRTPVTAYGPSLPGATEGHHDSDGTDQIVTTFLGPDGSVAAVAGFNAARRVIEMRERFFLR